MAGWMTMVVWTVGIVSSATPLATLTRWTMDYRSRESQSRGGQIQAQREMRAAMVSQPGGATPRGSRGGRPRGVGGGGGGEKTQGDWRGFIRGGGPAEPISLQQPSE